MNNLIVSLFIKSYRLNFTMAKIVYLSEIKLHYFKIFSNKVIFFMAEQEL